MQFRAISDDNRKLNLRMDLINLHVARYKPGTPFVVSVTRRIKRASDPQRKYYYGVVLPSFLDAYWYDRDDANTVHRHLKCLFFGIKPDGHGIVREKDIPSVFSDNPTVKIEERKGFMDWVIRKCAMSPDNAIIVPEPGG